MPDAQCSQCGGTDISESNFCNDCGNVVCYICGNEGEGDGWDEVKQEDGEYYSYCKTCGGEVRTGHNPFAE